MLRLLTMVMVLSACDESDPANSQGCVEARMAYIEWKYQVDNWERMGVRPQLIAAHRADIARFQSLNWQCFK